MSEEAILFDATKCIACRGCQVACKQWNELTAAVTTNRGGYENPPDLSPATWMTIRFREQSDNGKIRWLFSRHSCMHCTDAACIDVCPSGALYHNEHGFVSYDKEKCIGCGYCTQYCPFEIPRIEQNIATGIGKMSKCSLCTTPGLDRLNADQEPACVKTCPTGALIFGDREKLIAEGNRRVDFLKSSQPERYPGAVLYGENELGGLHVLYVLADTPQTYGLPEKPEYPVMATVQKDILSPYTWVAWGVVAAGLALNVLVARARSVKEKEETE